MSGDPTMRDMRCEDTFPFIESTWTSFPTPCGGLGKARRNDCPAVGKAEDPLLCIANVAEILLEV